MWNHLFTKGHCKKSSSDLCSSLDADHGVIDAPLRQQLVVRAALLDSAILEDHDHVGTLDGGQAVSNHDAGAAFPRLVQGLLDHLLTSRT